MNFFYAALAGIIQGITEFLPVSSSGHLVLFHKFINLPLNNELAFDVALHLATLLAVIYFFRKDIILIVRDWFLSFRDQKSENSRLGWLIILGSFPAAIIGLSFQDFIENVLRDEKVVVFMLVFIGILFIVAEKYSKRLKKIESLTPKDSIVIGFAQALALIPGTSRSGSTVLAGLALGFKREVALKFSFLLSIPVIFGANIKELPSLSWSEMSASEIFILFIAFFSALVSGFLTVRFFMSFARNNSLNIFAYYRFILAFVLCLILFL